MPLSSQVVPAALSKIYVFACIIPANPRDQIVHASGGFIVNDPLVSGVLSEQGVDLPILLNNLELGVRFVVSFLFAPEAPLTHCIRNRVRELEGYPPEPNGVRVEFNTNSQLRKKATTCEIDAFDNINKQTPYHDIELDTSDAMTEVLKRAPKQSAWWKDKRGRLPELWWQFLYLLFHRDPGLGGLDAECNGIIRRFRKYVLLMPHDPMRKHRASALALVDHKSQIVKLFMT